ncbi:FeS assembly protein SufD [Beutenbergia cavernae DSM 12333]|uniref:FeS assembly protein SufD n=2 Tax=Beutenbergia TaxID=84756 RepID=C5BVY9_BEUC1|nr:FeS assembly protein SufD [Beutenbergia cavernae DSM 12333]
MAQAMTTDHSRAQADAAHTHGGGTHPESSRADRASSFALADFPLPNGREEEWRFSPVQRLQRLFAGELTGTGPRVEVSAAPGVGVEIVDHHDSRLGVAGAPGDRIAAAAWEGFREATVVTVPANHVAETETTIALRGASSREDVSPSAAHVTVIAETFSEAVVVLDHTGGAELAQTVEIVVHDGAKLTLVSVQDWDAGAVHVASHRASVGRDASLKHIVVTLGGDVVRLTPDAAFTGTGGNVEMLGLYYADAGQHQEHRLFVDHAQPHCTSRVTYKGALQGDGARSVWVGDVLIRKEAEGTDTYELNRNLVLTDGARADSVPNLEIETGEIEGAGHASATGRFDDEQLFYLKSRGIPEATARRLVVRGFFAELIQQIGVPSIEERLIAAIEVELSHTGE